MSTEYQRLHAENGLNVNASPWTGPSAHLGANTYAPSASPLPLATTILRPNGTPVGNPSVTSSPPTVQYSSASLDYPNQDRIVCKFFLQGGCGRGENCSYLHELPQDSTLSAVADCNVTGIVFNVNAKNTAAIQRQGSAEPNSTSGSSMGHSATTPGHLTHQHLHHPSNNNTLLHHHISNENELAFGYDTYGAYGQVSIPSNGWSGLETSNTSGPVIEYHANHLAHDLAQGTNTGAGALYNQGSFPQNSLDAVYYHTDSGNTYTNATSTTHAAGPTSNTPNSVSTSGAANFHASPGSASNTTTSTLLIPSSNMTTAAAWNLGTHSAVNTATTLQVVGSNVLGAGTDATATSTAGCLGTSNGATQNILTSGPNEHGLPTSHNRHIFDPNCTTTTTTTTTTHHHLHHHHHPSHPHAHAHPHGSAPHIMSSTHHHTLGLPSSNAQQGTSIVPASSKGLLSGNNSTTSASQTITSQPSASGTGARNVQISSRNSGTQELDAATQLRLASAALQQGASPSGYLNAAISQRSTNSAQNSMGTAPHTSHSSQSVPLSGHTSTTGNYNSGMGDTTSTVSKEMKGLNKLSNRGGNNSNSVTINQHFGSDALGSGSASIASHRAQNGGVLHNKGIHSEHREGAGSNSISPSQRRILHISKTSRMAERIIPASTEALIDPMVNEIVGTMSGPTKKPLSNKFLPVTIQSYLKSSCNFLAESGSENMSASNKCGVQTNSGGGGGKNKSGKTHHGRNNRSHH